MKKGLYILGSLTLFIVLLSVAQITLTNAFSTDGIVLSKMDNQIVALQKENMVLKEQLYTQSSYTNIASVAATMGFVEGKSQIALETSRPLAIKQ